MESKPDISIPEMLAKLDLMFKKQSEIEKQVAFLYKEYEQLSDDIDIVQTLIMHQSNKQNRKNETRFFFN